MKILIIEDDAEIAAYLEKGLKQAGHVVDHSTSGRDGLFLATTGTYDVLVIDRMLPELDGLTVVRTLRAGNIATPVLMLTALGRVEQRVEGLETGADDYLVKPFAFTEFLARVTALSRRPALSNEPTSLTCGGLTLDRLKRKVFVDGEDVDLQPREFALVETLLLHQGQVLTRTMLLEKVWNFHFDPKTNIVETHISRVRTKLGRAKDVISTRRGEGYVAQEPA
jgi:two-component system, OmpR family, response regulator